MVVLKLGSRQLVLPVAVCAALMLVAAGCSFSQSSRSSSESSSASSRSSSGGGGAPDSGGEVVQETLFSYQAEVSALTVLYAVSGGEPGNFQREISEIAKRHNLYNWGNQRETFLGIGKGLRRANVAEDEIDLLPFLGTLQVSNNYTLIFVGYNADN